jgi:hypothetical protein
MLPLHEIASFLTMTSPPSLRAQRHTLPRGDYRKISEWNIPVKEVESRHFIHQVDYSHFEFFTDTQLLLTLAEEASQ